ncbi:lytic transglycosylase domain-containing protein [Pseudothauera nasutitermitis]|uniref:Lytic transglycosylase domain-containing protein n=1 Tax=Pseudothauera nasutitermitis TaxID=2565930 RepID=A0A4S4AX12_9RHOO|nr:lytic transglycosylase domain-containing protein [Pseudothauera nasutitermitis]THF64617.1 lytic transglycosylase domain-containing protein [Pseudothauera nasutitermitis]
MVKRLWGGLALIGWLLANGSAMAQSGDARILAAREALRTGDRATLERLAAQRQPHELDAYVQYWLLFNRLARPEPPPANELREFLAAHEGTLLAERLRGDWLRRLAKDGEWREYLNVYAGLQRPDDELTCQSWRARQTLGDAQVVAEVAALWNERVNHHAACEPVLRALALERRVSVDDIWSRIRRQVEGRDTAPASVTLSWLPVGEAPSQADFNRALGNPGQYLAALPATALEQRAGRELVLAAIVRLARENPEEAYLHLLRLGDRLGAEKAAQAHAALALRAAYRQLPQAVDWFVAAGDAPLSAEQRAWRVRSALRVGDWGRVRQGIEALPAAERERPEWIYWLARAHVALGSPELATLLYERIAAEPNFYGLLAAEELGSRFVLPGRAGGVMAPDRARAEGDPGLRRALALYRLDMRLDAVREWNWALRGRDEGFLLAAAELALRNDIYDRAINTAELAGAAAHFELRFITPYRQVIEPQVQRQGLDMSWVYGLMRQESRFIAPARSSAGAQGLMQVMPATGKWVAGKIGLRNYHPRMLTDPDTNVLLGTSYMRLILDDLDNHPVLASAGYNAGPGRARRWRDDRPMEGAIYAETIPFDETRDYVKKVMANTVIYAAMLEGRPQSLKSRLGVVAPRPPGS